MAVIANLFNMLLTSKPNISVFGLTLFGALNIFINLSHADTSVPHNNYPETSFSSAHYRRAGEVKFGNWVDERKKVMRVEEKAATLRRIENYEATTRKQAEKFRAKLPPLPQCERTRTILKKRPSSKSSINAFDLDLLFFDPLNGQDRSSAEIWLGKTVPYEPEHPSNNARLGHLLGLECLPTRIISTPKGLEFRTADLAWKIKSKDSDQRNKVFEREMKIVRDEKN